MPKEPYHDIGPQCHYRWVFLHDHTWVDRYGWRWSLTEMEDSYLENVRGYLLENSQMWQEMFYEGAPTADETEQARRKAEDSQQWVIQTRLWAALGAEITRRNTARQRRREARERWEQAKAFAHRPSLAALLTQGRADGN